MRWLKVELLSYWHAGSGRGEGPAADALVIRTPEGLPLLPGKTLKGLLRRTAALAEEAGKLEVGRTRALFGGQPDDDAPLGTRRFSTSPGQLRVGNAELGEDNETREVWRAWARADQGRALVPGIFERISSTAIGEDGLVKDRTLRTVEVTVPVTLYAKVDADEPGDDWARDLESCLPLLRELGSRRSRGLGRCRVTWKEAVR